MKYYAEQTIIKFSAHSCGLNLSKAFKAMKMQPGESVIVSIPDDYIKIERMPKTANVGGKIISKASRKAK